MRKALKGRQCGQVRILAYESPYSVKGIIKLTGVEWEPKSINVQIGSLEQGKVSEMLICI